MKFLGIPIPVFLLLFVATILVVNFSSTSISQHHIQFSFSPLLLFSLFNIIILAIILGSYRPSADEVNVGYSCFQFPYEVVSKDIHDSHENDNNYEDEDDYDEYYGSDGYIEDDDDNGSDDEIGWDEEEEEEEEEYDEYLQKRFEDFIVMVKFGWREERLNENLHD